MTDQVFIIPAATIFNDLTTQKQWRLDGANAVLVDDIFEPNNTRYLRRVLVFNNTGTLTIQMRLLFGSDTTEAATGSNDDLIESWETRDDDAIGVAQGSAPIWMPGPANAVNVIQDSIDSYFWGPPLVIQTQLEQFFFTDLDTAADWQLTLRIAGAISVDGQKLTAQAASHIGESIPKCAWICTLKIDEFNLAPTIYNWTTFKGLFGYDDDFLSNITLGSVKLKNRGGFSSVAQSTIALVDVDNVSAIAEDSLIENSEVSIGLVFIDGNETTADVIELFKGVINSHVKSSGVIWSLTIKDDSINAINPFPKNIIDFSRYPYAEVHFIPLPVIFGINNSSPVAILNKFTGLIAHGGDTIRSISQWYGSDNILAECLNVTNNNNGTSSVDSAARRILLSPISAHIDNNTSQWETPPVPITDTLQLYFSGTGVLGELLSIKLNLQIHGAYTIVLKISDDVIIPETRQHGPTEIILDTTHWQDNWPMAITNILITGSASCLYNSMELIVDFEDFHRSNVSVYRVDADGTTGQNPVTQLRRIFTNDNFIALDPSKLINGWDEAEILREDWKFDWTLWERQENVDILERFCFQAGLVIYPQSGGFSIAALDHTRISNTLY